LPDGLETGPHRSCKLLVALHGRIQGRRSPPAIIAERAFLFHLEFFMADFIPVRQLGTLDTNQKNRRWRDVQRVICAAS
jgi:hypothetical protein